MTETAGYVEDISYTYGYYRETNPNLLKMACLVAGVAPQLRDKFKYLELGFGQGLSINIHAAATRGSFWGTDFNPEHTVNARQLAASSRAGIQLFDNSFVEFLSRPDLPDFDIIVLHGIWSWVSDANRKTIIEIIRRKLRAGGIVYISYNCLPGWASAIPIRQMLRLYQAFSSIHMGDQRQMVEGALKFCEDVISRDPILLRDNPGATAHIQSLRKHPANYIAHEYMNQDWHLVNFSEMIDDLKETKLHFVGSARLLDRVDGLNLANEARTLVNGIGNPILRETVRDYMVNQRFRADVFVKGPRVMTIREQRDTWHAQLFVLTTCDEEIPKMVDRPLGQAELPARIYDPVIEALSDGEYSPKSIADLLGHPKTRGLQEGEIGEALIVLTGAGFVSPAQHPDQEIIARSKALNLAICQRALVSMEINSLASPVTGGGIPVPHICQLFILAIQNNNRSPEAITEFVWDFLSKIDQKLERDGIKIESAEDNAEEINKMARIFIDRTWPLLRALKVV